jgi:hypothetical protein
MPFVNGMAVVKGMKTPLNPGTYTVTEINTSDRDYGTPSYSGACAQNGLTGIVTINAGDSATCVITNTPVGGWAAVAAPSVSTCGGGCAPTMPNTGFGGASLPALNTLGLLLIAGLAWTERSSEKGSF